MKKIKFNNLNEHHNKIKNNLYNVLNKSIKTSSFIGGDEVKKFENNFKKLNQSRYCVSCGNGSDALYIAIKALGIKTGDEVIVTALSWIASSAAITTAGGKVVFCDIEKDSFNIDPKLIEKKITKKTVGIIVVHLYGYPTNMEIITKILNKRKLWCIEDCAQAHLAEIKKKKVGNFGNFGTFSFFPGKNFGALGDAGCLVTNNRVLARKARLIANHGGKGLHLFEGINSRMDTLQAGFLNVKMKNIKQQTQKRINNAKLYNSLLNINKKIKIPIIHKTFKPVFHQYTIRVKNRNQLKKYLEKKGIETQIHYKQALVEMKAYKYLNLNIKKNFSEAKKITKEILCLPVSPDKTKKQIKYIANTILDFYK